MQTIQETGFVKTYTHFASIICCPEDRMWAGWLKRRLQRYRLPVKTQQSHRNLPRHCRPIFSSVKEKQQSAINTSKFLIVICSRHAREHSDFMNRQIRSYLEGNGEVLNILPIIVSDCKHPVQESFPTYLEELCREQTIVGTNVFDQGRHTALMKLLAAMFGVRVEELEGAEARRKRRNTRIAAALAVLLLLCGLGYWDYNREKTAYYLDYTEVYGAPAGIGKLGEKELPGMHRYYALTRRQGHVREIVNVSAPGTFFDMGIAGERMAGIDFPALVEPEKNFQRAVYDYDENRNLKSVEFYDKDDDLLLSRTYVNENTMDVAQKKGNSLLPSWQISRLLAEYDENGYLTELRYVDQRDRNRAAADKNGVFGLRYERDGEGRCLRSVNLINSGGNAEFASTYSPGAGLDGVLAREYEYTPDGELCAYRLIGAEGQPVPGGEGYAALQISYNDRHNPSQISFIGADGKPFYLEKGYCTLHLLFGEKGEISGHRFLDGNGAAAMCSDGYAGYDSQFDKYDFESYTRYIGVDGEPVLNSEGFCAQKVVRDLEELSGFATYLDTEGRPIEAGGGVVSLKREFDRQFTDNVIRESYYNADGQPMLNMGGVAGFTKEYDAWGCEKCLRYFDTEGKPAVNLIDGFCSAKSEYNQKGLLVRQSYYDAEDRPTLYRRYLYHSKKDEYDSRGSIVSESYYGKDGSLVRSVYGDAHVVIERWPDGSEKTVYNYDDKGNLLTRECVAAYYEEKVGDSLSLRDLIIVLSLGDWQYDNNVDEAADYFTKLDRPVTLEYLRYDETDGDFVRCRSDIVMGEMNLRIVGYDLTEEEYKQILEAAKGETRDGPLERHSKEGIKP